MGQFDWRLEVQEGETAVTLAEHPISICIKDAGDELYLVIEGELVDATAPELLDCFPSGISSDICLDVSSLDFVDSTGLFALKSLEKRARISGTKFTIRFPNQQLLKLLGAAGLTDYFDLRDADGSRIGQSESRQQTP